MYKLKSLGIFVNKCSMYYEKFNFQLIIFLILILNQNLILSIAMKQFSNLLTIYSNAVFNSSHYSLI